MGDAKPSYLPGPHRRLLGLLTGGFVLLAPVVRAQEGPALLVAPTRIVFEGESRTAAVSILNTGPQTTTYRIHFVQRRMREDGAFEAITEPAPGERFADRMVRFAPRQVVLPPGRQQTVRLLLEKPPNLEPGEYRSHLLFQAVPPGAGEPGLLKWLLQADGTGSADPGQPSGVQLRLTPVFGVSIPVIVRHGRTVARVALSDLRWEAHPPTGRVVALSLRIHRTGNRSVYGNLRVGLVGTDGREQVIGEMNGVAVYTPNAFRVVQVPVRLPAGVVPRKTLLRVTYRDAEHEDAGILAQAEVTVP